MHLRPATADDVTALHDLQQAYETAWFTAQEQSRDEVAEAFGHADAVCVAVDGGRVVGQAARWPTRSVLVGDPAADLDAVYGLLVAWLEQRGAPEVEALDRDERLRAVLAERGWRHIRSSVELTRTVDAGLRLPDISWPDGIALRPWLDEHAAVLHHLIYVESGWTDVDGHDGRTLPEWHRLLLDGRRGAELPVLVWDADRPVGAAVLRHFDDGTGWVAQLAVARTHRRRGLARSLLAESYRRLIDDGATSIGLGVVTTNRSALDLYLSVGLIVDREWLVHRRDGVGGGTTASTEAATP